MAVWIRSTLPAMVIDELFSSHHELIWLSIQLSPGQKIVLGAAYRPGSTGPSDLTLINHLDDILPSARALGANLILLVILMCITAIGSIARRPHLRGKPSKTHAQPTFSRSTFRVLLAGITHSTW